MIRKLFIILSIWLFSVAASAQTVEASRFFENTEISIQGGATTTTHSEIFKNIRPVAGLEVGKYVTPVVGFGIEGLTYFNTTGANTFVDQSNVVGNLKLNMSNWIGSYKGEPRLVEVVLVPGLGWLHNYGNIDEIHEANLLANPEDRDIKFEKRNISTYNLGAEVNFNLGSQKAWQIRVKPTAVWYNYGNALRPLKSNLQAQATVGLVYKFGSKSKKSHNFVLAPRYSYTDAEYKALLADLEYARNNPKVVEKVVEVPVEKVVQVTVERTKIEYAPLTVSYSVASSKISSVELEKVKEYIERIKAIYDEDVYIIVEGSADSGTGLLNYNNNLAQRRAEAVEKVLKDAGFKNIKTESSLDSKGKRAYSRAATITVIAD